MIWRYASRAAPSTNDISVPELGNPLPIHSDGRLLSQDLGNARLEWEAILRGSGQSRFPTVPEIGAGYDRFAYVVLHENAGVAYTIVDIEPALSISKKYLSALFPDPTSGSCCRSI